MSRKTIVLLPTGEHHKNRFDLGDSQREALLDAIALAFAQKPSNKKLGDTEKGVN